MKTIGFSHLCLDATTYQIVEHFESGSSRVVSPEYVLYQRYAGEVPKVAGNPFVTVHENGTVTYDGAGAAAATEAATWVAIRARRNTLLAASDWTQGSDCKLTGQKKQEYKDYRQDLRDLPQKFASTADVIFPEAPR